MGVLESRQGGRYTVTDVSPSRLVAPFNAMLSVADFDVHEHFEARVLVDCELVRLCTRRAAPDVVQRILKLAVDGVAFHADPIGFRLLDVEFHQAINRGANHQLLSTVSQGLYDLALDFRRLASSVPGNIAISVRQHIEVAEALVIRLAEAAKPLNIHWWEEVLSPEDNDGYREIKRAHPALKWTTAEHEYTRYGFRQLICERIIDIVQPDLMWVGGLTETLRIAAHAAAYDIPVVPHGSGPYSYHFIASQTGPAFCEYVAASPDGKTIHPVFGELFVGEPVPLRGRMKLSDAPGFGMELRDRSILVAVS